MVHREAYDPRLDPDVDPEDLKLRPWFDPYHFVQWWREQVDKPRFVYFIQEVTGLEDGIVQYGAVKIGEAFDPKGRLAELQCGNPRILELRAVVLATDDMEHSLHLQWVGVAGVRGEWFGNGFENAIVELAQLAQRQQYADHERGVPLHLITERAKWTIGIPRAARDHGIVAA